MNFYFREFYINSNTILSVDENPNLGFNKSLGLLFQRENGIQEVYLLDQFSATFSSGMAISTMKRFVKVSSSFNAVDFVVGDIPTINGIPMFRANGNMLISNEYGIRLSDGSSTGLLFEHFKKVLDENGNETNQLLYDDNNRPILKEGYIGMYDYYYHNVILPIIINGWKNEVQKRIEASGNSILE